MQLDGAQAAAAQRKMGTCYPVRCVDRRYHAEPKDMRLQLIKALGEIAGEFDASLVAMGFCGGSLESVCAPARVVVRRADGAPRKNLKEPGHIYIRDTDTGRYSLEGFAHRSAKGTDASGGSRYSANGSRATRTRT